MTQDRGMDSRNAARAPFPRRSRRRWTLAGGCVGAWLVLYLIAGSVISATLLLVVKQSVDGRMYQETAAQVEHVMTIVESEDQDGTKLRKLWDAVKVAATTNEAVGLIARIGPLLLAAPHH